MKVFHPTRKIKAHLKLPGSKSESNRALVLNALSANKLTLHNLSTARDTQILIDVLSHDDTLIDVLDAGTAMRFLTAYYCVTNRHKIISGSQHLNQRPIAPLVNALSEMGFDIRYKANENFPPLEVHPVNTSKIADEVWVEGNISSQFITALLLIAPFLLHGLRIKFTTELVSKPYIEMTVKMLREIGAQITWENNYIVVEPLPEFSDTQTLTITPDWSAASYWYSIAFLADEAEILLEGLQDDYTQGDRVMADWMKRFGVMTEFHSTGATLRKTEVNYPTLMKLNFKDNPDIAQTFAFMFAAKNICCTFSGIESLKIKETNRIAALQNELLKVNVHFNYAPMYRFYQLKGEFKPSASAFKTYNDHRMAMCIAPLALTSPVEIENAEVVQKSYPEFWLHLQQAGFETN